MHIPVFSSQKGIISLVRKFFVVIVPILMLVTPVFALIERVSISSLSVEGDGTSRRQNVSADGQYVVFQSDATNLIPGDTNGGTDVFIYDRNTDIVERVSISDLGAQGNAVSGGPGVSSDGRYVVFTSQASNLVPGDTNLNGGGFASASDIFVYDRNSDTIERASVDNGGVEGDNDSQSASISPDGRYVTFQSIASNLVPGDTNGTPFNSASDIFVYDRNSDTIERVSVDNGGVEGNNDSLNPSFSDDARYVAFDSNASNLVLGDTNSTTDVFVYDRNSDTIERVSVDDLGNEGDAGGSSPKISADGRYVTFNSDSTNLVAGDTNGFSDIFVYDRQTDTIERVSVDSFGAQGDNASESPAISGDGRYVVFDSLATNLVAGDTNSTRDAFVHDRQTGITQRLSINSNLVEGDFSSGSPKISSDGLYAVFESDATNLVAGDMNSATDVFVRGVNDAPTDIGLSPASINENEAANTVVGTLTTADADGADTHAYSLACAVPGADDASFTIAGSALRSSAPFDYEAKSSYAICIRTDDGNGGTYDENFTIAINNMSEGSSGGSGTSGPSNPPVPGCTNSGALNFNSAADVDDGSCQYTPGAITGCTDSAANNYSASATVDDGTCNYDVVAPRDPEDPLDPADPDQVSGCTNSGALNFNSAADVDDGSCNFTLAIIYGCTDVSASNFDASANKDDGSCTYIGVSDSDTFGEVIGGAAGVVKEIPEEILFGISIVGIAGPGLLVNFLQPGLLMGLISIPIRLWNLIPILMDYKRRKRPWGTVYDSVTKQPLDPVYVTLNDMNGAEQGSSITDLDGRYGFLAEAGTYKLLANKDNYVFPSTKLAGKTQDQLYDNLYFGDSIELTEKEGVIYKNIPMDAINFNWNEFAKAENKKLMKFYSKRDLFFARIAKTLFITGLLCSLILFIVDNSLLNTVILSLYALILVLRIFGVKPKQSGYAYDTDGTPLSYGIIKLFSSELNREVGHTVIGKTGRYYMLAPNGNYYMKVFRKTDETSYEDILITDTFRVKGGYVRKVIRA
jgi:archaellum component FlaF (FlaF/FlaG flagellin family)